MTDYLEQVFAPDNHTIELETLDPHVIDAVAQFIGDDKTDESIIDFGNSILQSSGHPSFPHALFDQSLIEQQYEELDLHLDRPFLAGLYASQHMEDQSEKLWAEYIAQRQLAIDKQDGDEFVPLSITESKMVGYLVGRKLATGDSAHRPSNFDKKLANLDKLAEKIYPAFRPEFSAATPTTLANVIPHTGRN